MLVLGQLEWGEEQINNKTVLAALTWRYILVLAAENLHPSMKNSKAIWKNGECFIENIKPFPEITHFMKSSTLWKKFLQFCRFYFALEKQGLYALPLSP